MASLKISTVDGRTAFEPGETIEVLAEWQLEERPDRVEVRLVWYTSGKGERDWSLVEAVPFENVPLFDSRRCELHLPDSPYSFSGKLISLVWAIEVIVEPGDESRRLDITVAPSRKEVLLHRGDRRP